MEILQQLSETVLQHIDEKVRSQELDARVGLAAQPARRLLQELRGLLRSILRTGGPYDVDASEFRAHLHRLMTLIIQDITDADCVFVRRRNTDGSVELMGAPVWSREEHGRPPRIKLRGEGVSACVFDADDPQPVVLRDVWGDGVPEECKAAHEATLKRWAKGTPEHEFISFIRAEIGVPFVARGNVLGGIVAIRGKPYDAEHAERLQDALRTWQDVITALYHVGLRLERHEHLQERLKSIVHAFPLLTDPTATNEEFIRKVLTTLSCNGGLGWHRAMMFFFDHGYPSSARCVMAIGGTGEARWSDVQAEVAKQYDSLHEYLLIAEESEYGRDDPLFEITRSKKWAIPAGHFEKHELLDPLFSADTHSDLQWTIEDGVVPLYPDDKWLSGLPGFRDAFREEALTCTHFLVPLIAPFPLGVESRPRKHISLGFVIVDCPYVRTIECSDHLSLTRLVCDLVAPYLANRGLAPRNKVEMPISRVEALMQEDLRMLSSSMGEEMVRKLGEAYQNLGERTHNDMFSMYWDRPSDGIKTVLGEIGGKVREHRGAISKSEPAD